MLTFHLKGIDFLSRRIKKEETSEEGREEAKLEGERGGELERRRDRGSGGGESLNKRAAPSSCFLEL